MLKNYFIVAWRNLTRRKLYTAIHVIGLAVGICACMTIWSVTHYELSFDKFHPDRDRIYRVVTEIGQPSGVHAYWGDICEPAMPAIRKELTGLETVAQFHNINPMITIPRQHGKPTRIMKKEGAMNDVVLAEPEYFDIFHYQWIAGDPSTLKEPFHVVLTTAGAKKYFGQSAPADVLGRTIIYDDSIPVTVTGIVKDLNQVTEFTFTDFISYATARAKLASDLMLDSWGNVNSASETFVKLAKGESMNRVNAELKAFTDRHRQQIMGDDKSSYLRYQLQPLSDLHYSAKYDKNYGSQADMPTLYRLMGVAAFILILASINFINLSTAQSLRRAKEIGIRKVLGSRRAALVLQFMSETLVLALLALVLSLMSLRPLQAAFSSFMPAGFKINLLDLPTIGFALGVLLLAALLSGLYPALVLSSFQPARTLKGDRATPGSLGRRLSGGLVVFQFTISAVFVIASIVVGDQMRHMLHKDLGFNRDAIIRFEADQKDPWDRKTLLAERLRTLPGVAGVSLSMAPPAIDGASRTDLENKRKEKMAVDVRISDTNYLSLYQLKLIAGRNYFASDTLREIVINTRLAKALGYQRAEDALGQPLPMWGKNPMIVGIVADFNTRSAQYGIGPTMILNQKENESGFDVRLRMTGKTAADMKQTIDVIEKNWTALFPNEPFRYQWMDAFVKNMYQGAANTEKLVNLAMIITILVSCMGLFGLAALTAEQRTREIGIRKVLGAGVGNIVTMISRDFVLLVAIALVIASPLAWYFLHDWLQGFEYRVTIGWWVFVLASLGALSIALLAVGFHALRAAIVSPVKSLRSE